MGCPKADAAMIVIQPHVHAENLNISILFKQFSKAIYVDSIYHYECQNGCIKVKISREDMKALRKECPLESIQYKRTNR